MAESTMFGNIFDVKAEENAEIRSRALSTAQLQPGRASVYGASQAGGMLMQNLAEMAGMKSVKQEKTELVTSIMQEASKLDMNDPKSSLIIAQRFNQAGLTGLAQKFSDQARVRTVKNKELSLQERQVVVQEEAQDQSEFQFSQTFSLDKEKFGHLQYKDEAYIDIATNQDTRDQAKFDYAQVQDGIINEIRQGELTIAQARSALEQNDFEFREARALVSDEQWQSDYDIKELISKADIAYKIATTDNIILENEAFTYNNNIKNANIEAQTAASLIQTKLQERNLSMPPEGEFIKVDDRLQRFNPETNTYDDVTDPALLVTGEYGLSTEESKVYDNIWDQYKQRFFVGSDITGGGQWEENTPDFLDWAQKNVTGEQGLNIIMKGQGGTRAGYNLKLETDFNNSQVTDGSEVAGTVTTEGENGQTRQDVKVEKVDMKRLGDLFQVDKTNLSKIPAKIDGKANTLTNAQYLTQLIMESKVGEATEYASSLEGQKVEMSGREGNIKKTEPELEEISSTEFIKYTFGGKAFKERMIEEAIERGEYKRINGKVYRVKK
jgi:hypothetical protein